jgi:hypothetical protein
MVFISIASVLLILKRSKVTYVNATTTKRPESIELLNRK